MVRRSLWAALAIVAFAAPARTARAQGNTLDRAAWLAGCWEQRTATRSVVEMWMPPQGDLMLGASRTVVSGQARAFEHLRLHAAGDTIVYTALPSGQAATAFRGTVVTPDSLVVENPSHDFPTRITYRRRGADSLVARVEGPGPNGTMRGFSLAMRRVPCAAP